MSVERESELVNVAWKRVRFIPRYNPLSFQNNTRYPMLSSEKEAKEPFFLHEAIMISHK